MGSSLSSQNPGWLMIVLLNWVNVVGILGISYIYIVLYVEPSPQKKRE